MGVTALLLMALTFYSTLTLGDATMGGDIQRPAAIVVLCVLLIPFGTFLWWLALGRVLAHKVMFELVAGSRKGAELNWWLAELVAGSRKGSGL